MPKEWIYIDAFLKGTEPFWRDMVENCVIDCCGWDSLELTDERILRASSKVNTSMLLEKLQNLIGYLEDSPLQKIQSHDIINHGSDKDTFIKQVEGIRKVIIGVHK